MALVACGGKVPDVAATRPKPIGVAPASHEYRFTAAIPIAALRCSHRIPDGDYERENITLWLDVHSFDLARYAPNCERHPYDLSVAIDLLALGKDCGELARLRELADACGMLNVEGIRKWR